MAIAFLSATIAVIYNYKFGIHQYGWPLAAMLWIMDGFFKQRTIDRIEKRLEILNNEN